MSEEDNRKRVHQQDENDAANSSKRAAIVQGGAQEAGNAEEPEPFYFKLLCPQGITGLIIGKGGANIIQLNATTGARIKLSQNNEYFPNTTDRILLISGGKQGMENAIRELVSRIVEAPEKRQAPGEFLKQQTAPRPSGTYTIRVLIPKIASAAVIGKGGVVIKRMSEQSGCRFQLGEENDPFNTNERIVTITGTTSPSVVTGAIHIMFQLLDEAPRIRTYTNPTTNYSGRSGAPHQGVPQNIPHHMMGGQPPAAMMAPPGFVPYGAVPPPYVLQYSHMGQIQVPMQQAMFPQGMAPQSGYPMQAAQFPMGGAPPGSFVAAPAPMYAQYPPGQPVMDMGHAYQQQQQQHQQQQQQHPHQHQQQHFGAKPIYASPGPQGGMPIHQQIPQQQILHQHQPAQLGNHYGGGGSIHNGGKMK